MSKKINSAWSSFSVGVPALKGFNQDCLKFETVSHTSHVTTAMNILEEGEIRPYLVFDESKLNDQRILVSWLSPNYWGVGFRYGNVYFDFDFKELIKGKRFYWVEAIAYQIEACRILVTDKDHDGVLDPYDPTLKDGPWWHDLSEDLHYYNGTYCLEFMFECPISLDSLSKFDFVSHHNKYCSVHRYDSKNCKELGMRSPDGGALFISRAVAVDANLNQLTSFLIVNNSPNSNLESAFERLQVRVTSGVSFGSGGNIEADSELAIAVAEGICSAFSFHKLNGAKNLAALFKTKEECILALAKLVGGKVGLADWAQLLDE